MAIIKEVVTVTGPSVWPVTVAEMKEELLIDHGIQDDVIQEKIYEATQEIERYLGLRLITQTVKEGFDGISYPYPFFKLSVAPVISITTFQYYLNGYQGGTVSDFLLDTYGRPAIIQLKPNKTLPSTDTVANRFVFTYTCGYGAAASDVPYPIKKAIKARVASSFEDRIDKSKRWLDRSFAYIRNYKNSI